MWMLRRIRETSRMITKHTDRNECCREGVFLKKQEPIRMLSALFLAVSLIFVLPAVAENGDAGFAETREISSKESYFDLARENETIRKERDRAVEEVANLRRQNSSLLVGMKDLESRIQLLNGRIEESENALSEQKKSAEETISRLSRDVDEALAAAEETERKLDKQDYVRRYKDARKQLEGARRALGDMAKERSKELADSEKMMRDLAKENEKLKTDIGKAHFNLGTLLFRSGEYEKSAYEYEKAAKVMPNDPDIFYNLAIIYDFYVDEPEKAKGYYERYFRAEPNPGRKKQLKERMAEKQLLSVMNEYQVE
jgi:tetratricopeptide (TPR) repeat protein